jgi:xanthine dehydrogenase accessory factor
MKKIYQKIVESFRNDTLSVLATIIKQAGPSPRGIGTKCLIMQDGSFIGTIGGGVVEAKTINAAMKVFDTGIPVRLSFSLKGSDVADTDMLCGGDMEVFLEPVSPKFKLSFNN